MKHRSSKSAWVPSAHFQRQRRWLTFLKKQMCVTCLRVRDEVLQGALAAPGLAPPLNALTAATAATAASLRFFRRREDSGVASVPATEGVPACAAAAAAVGCASRDLRRLLFSSNREACASGVLSRLSALSRRLRRVGLLVEAAHLRQNRRKSHQNRRRTRQVIMDFRQKRFCF